MNSMFPTFRGDMDAITRAALKQVGRLRDDGASIDDLVFIVLRKNGEFSGTVGTRHVLLQQVKNSSEQGWERLGSQIFGRPGQLPLVCLDSEQGDAAVEWIAIPRKRGRA